MSNLNTSNDQNDKKIDAKFDYLLNEITKVHLDDNKLFKELDTHLETKFSSFLCKIKTKIEIKCKDEIDKLRVYTEYKSEIFKDDKSSSITDFVATKGYEKEFEESMNKFKECTNNLTYLETDINNNSKTVSDLTLFSNEMCLDECRKDVKKHRHSEYEVRKCLESCMRYRKYNLEAYFRITFDNIDNKEKLLEKI